MLAITLRSFLRSSRMPIVFVPVYIGYERVLEGRTYLGELRGASKKKESIFDIFKVVGALKQRFGQVAVNFGEPIKLAEFLDSEQPDWRAQELGPNYKPAWLNETTNRLGERVAQHLNEAAAINPVNLWHWRCCPPPAWPWTNRPWHASWICTWRCCARCPTRPTPPCPKGTAWH
jgi:glycerol-3-phosphate O-acyltransferase